MTLVKSFIENSFAAFIKSGGELVSEEQANERISVCLTRNNGKPCEFAGSVWVPFRMMGCQKCGCPFKTKPHFQVWKFGGEPIKCPHPEGNLWEPIDKKYKT